MKKLTYLTLKEAFRYEIPKIKGSRFITTLIPAVTQEQLEADLEKISKEYYDATHNCYAWRFPSYAHQDLFGTWIISAKYQRANDDGEPANTAGKPILSVLEGAQIFDVLAVVTRYFGGTLLGVGGLIQAYTQSVQMALVELKKQQLLLSKEFFKKYQLQHNYEQIAIVQYLIDKYQVNVLADQYDHEIKKTLSVNLGLAEALEKELVEQQVSFSSFEEGK